MEKLHLPSFFRLFFILFCCFSLALGFFWGGAVFFVWFGFFKTWFLCVEQASLKLKDPHASISQMLELMRHHAQLSV